MEKKLEDANAQYAAELAALRSEAGAKDALLADMGKQILENDKNHRDVIKVLTAEIGEGISLVILEGQEGHSLVIIRREAGYSLVILEGQGVFPCNN